MASPQYYAEEQQHFDHENSNDEQEHEGYPISHTIVHETSFNVEEEEHHYLLNHNNIQYHGNINNENNINSINNEDNNNLKPPPKANEITTFTNIVKTFAGAGTFGLPWALRQSGLLTGTILLIILAILSNYTMKLLVKCRRYIQAQEEYRQTSEFWKIRPRRIPIRKETIIDQETGKTKTKSIYSKRKPHPQYFDENGELITTIKRKEDPNDYIYEENRLITYADIGYEALGNFGSTLVHIMFYLCNLGVGTIYLVLMGSCLNFMVPALPLRIWLLCFIPLFIPLSWIRSYKYLVPFTFFGTVFLLAAIICLLTYGFIYQRHNMKLPWEYPHVAWIEPATVPVFIGSAMLLFCTQSMTLSLEQSMKRRKYFYWTLDASFLFVTVVNLAFGLLVFSFFPYNIKEVATNNLPQQSVFVYIIQSFLFAEVAFTYTVVLLPVSESIDLKVLSHLTKRLNKIPSLQKSSSWITIGLSCIARTLIVILTVGVAEIFGDNFGVVMSFIGAISPNALAFLLPPLFYLIIMRKTISLPTFILNSWFSNGYDNEKFFVGVLAEQ
ncbi:hypothetical protein ABK040_002304 [Willaertia magna]